MKTKTTGLLLGIAAIVAILLPQASHAQTCQQGECTGGQIEVSINGRLRCMPANSCQGLQNAGSHGGNINFRPRCGNSVCEADENFKTCPADCQVQLSCPDGFCDAANGEDFKTCPADCPAPLSCPDGFCDAANGEDFKTCPADCPVPLSCPDGFCDVAGGETHDTCPADCP